MPAAERVQAIDILRGLALFGIIAANMRGFAGPAAAYMLTPLMWPALPDRLAQAAIDIFVQGKFITLFALLFGAGAALGGGNTLALTLFQATVPDEMKGRFFSVLTTLAYAVMPLAFMVNGVLAERLSVDFCIAMNAAAVLLLSFVILLLPRIDYKPA